VVAIILIIAAIAIPNLLRARMAANESSAVASVRTINTAEVTYNSTYPTVGFAPGPGEARWCVGRGLRFPVRPRLAWLTPFWPATATRPAAESRDITSRLVRERLLEASTSVTQFWRRRSRSTRLAFVASALRKMPWFAVDPLVKCSNTEAGIRVFNPLNQ